MFKSTSVIQGILSKLISNARLFTISYLGHLSKDKSVKNTRSFVQQRLTNTSDNCFSEFYSLRNRVKQHNYNLVSGYKSIQDIDKDTAMIKNTEISVPTLTQVFSHALSKLEELASDMTASTVLPYERSLGAGLRLVEKWHKKALRNPWRRAKHMRVLLEKEKAEERPNPEKSLQPIHVDERLLNDCRLSITDGQLRRAI